MVKRRSASFASSTGVAARVAPCSTSGAARSAVRFQTTSSCPAASRLVAIRLPIIPSPIKPIFISRPLLSRCSADIHDSLPSSINRRRPPRRPDRAGASSAKKKTTRLQVVFNPQCPGDRLMFQRLVLGIFGQLHQVTLLEQDIA